MKADPETRKRILLGIALIAGAAVYRPLIFWAKNPWDLMDPVGIFATTGVAIVAVVFLFLVATRLRVRELPVAFLIAGIMFIALNYGGFEVVPATLWIALVVVLSILLHRRASDQLLGQAVLVALVVTVVAPTLQVGWQHITQRTPYPLVKLAPPVAADSTDRVEDILLIIVDSYPMVAVANDWYGYDTGPLERSLTTAGFQVPRISWSHNTYTGLAVPSLLQLDQVADDSPKGDWGNRRTRYDIIGGRNFVVGTLRHAGFKYTHVEGGWNGASCMEVDVCLKSTWLDEANWNLLSSSLVSDFLTDRYGSMEVGNTLRVVDHLRDLDVFGDGEHDFVYAHMMLPHHPFVVDAECNVVPPDAQSDSDDEYGLLRKQLECVDSLLIDVVARTNTSTAVLIAGDHGMRTRDQVASPSAGWSDADLAERLGALLAYKLPGPCDGPEIASNLHAMRSIMACSVTAELPSNDAGFLIGETDPVWASAERLTSIADRLRSGWDGG